MRRFSTISVDEFVSGNANSLKKKKKKWFHGGKLENLFLLFLAATACWILVLQPEIEPTSPALEAWSLNHWTPREVLTWFFYSGGRWSPVTLGATVSSGLLSQVGSQDGAGRTRVFSAFPVRKERCSPRPPVPETPSWSPFPFPTMKFIQWEEGGSSETGWLRSFILQMRKLGAQKEQLRVVERRCVSSGGRQNWIQIPVLSLFSCDSECLLTS